MDNPSLLPSGPKPNAGFSLVEVALAIGIIATAFIALFALIPTGLTTFRSAIDMSNETWITQDISSMVQTTDFKHIGDLDFNAKQEIYYYDEEGKATDTEQQQPPATADVKTQRLYAVKLLTEYMFRPNGADASLGGDVADGPPTGDTRWLSNNWRIIVVFAPYTDPVAMKDFTKVTNGTKLQSLPKTTNVHSRTFYVARMDSAIGN